MHDVKIPPSPELACGSCATLRARAEQAERERDASNQGWIEEARTLCSELEQVKRERDEARAEVERLRDRLQTAVDEQVSPHETLPAEELITLLEHSLAEGRHERERLRQALAAIAKAKGEETET